MKCLVLLCGLLALVAADTYSTENDDFDVETLIANKDELQAIINCFMETQPCNKVHADFKKDLPEAVETACAKCTDAQKHIFNRFLAATKADLPEQYNALKGKYDADGTRFATLEKAIANA